METLEPPLNPPLVITFSKDSLVDLYDVHVLYPGVAVARALS